MITNTKRKKVAVSRVTSRNRTQIFNPATGHYILRDNESGLFVDVKTDGAAYKAVKKEPVIVSVSPNINKDIANLAESAVIKVRNKLAKVRR